MSATTETDLRRALEDLARNYAFAWLRGARELFEALDADAWRRAGHSPSALLAELAPEALEARLADPAIRERVERLHGELLEELSRPSWWSAAAAADADALVAYFSAEFGVDESLPIYSGGLGVLAGDHLKSASDLGVPLVAVGLLYRGGYFRQEVDESGWQQEHYPAVDPERLGLTLERGPNGSPVVVTLDLAGEAVAVQIWRAQVGRVPLFLLDTALDANAEHSRGITSTLYGGDRELRIRQELVLGVGGVRALDALGIEPTVFHLNEGHSVLSALERVRRLVAGGATTSAAIDRVRDSSVFTTHTPVPAGNEVFDPGLARHYLGRLLDEAGLSWDEVERLAHADGHYGFGLTPLALRTAQRANGVSALHGAVSRRMWSSLWHDRAEGDVPIGHVTNGVHARTWLAPEVEELLRAHGIRPDGDPSDQGWDRAQTVPLADLWSIHCELRRRLVTEAGARLDTGGRLDPDALTIAFARRFATYKRAGLLLSDPDRLARLLHDADRPVQILVAGKSHPADEGGKHLIRRIVEFGRDGRAGGRVVFLHDYEMTLAQRLVQGADVWLNNPRRPHEASGTSGMKAALNGALNLSVLDGWWCEGFSPDVGWAFGAGDGDDETAQDERDAAELFRLLEEAVVPLFYERDAHGLPVRWAEMMRTSIARLGAAFNANRMVKQYAEELYLPAHRDVR